jgi:hypothetical protein
VVLVDWREKFSGVATQRGSQGENILQGNVALPSLDRADVGPVEAGPCCKLFLGDSDRNAYASEIVGKNVPWFCRCCLSSFFVGAWPLDDYRSTHYKFRVCALSP